MNMDSSTFFKEETIKEETIRTPPQQNIGLMFHHTVQLSNRCEPQNGDNLKNKNFLHSHENHNISRNPFESIVHFLCQLLYFHKLSSSC